MRARAVSALVLTGLALAPSLARADEPEPEIVYLAAPPPAPDRPPVPPPRPLQVRGLVEAGVTTAEMLGLRSSGLHLGVGLGVDVPRAFVPLELDLDLGETRGGLRVVEVKASLGAQAKLGRLRLGGGGAAGMAVVTRAPGSGGGAIPSFALDLHGLASVDLVSAEDGRGVFLGVKPAVGVRWGDTFFAWGHGTWSLRGTALIGARF